ncbi:MAG: hypothetical protein ACO3DT_12125 [Gammaproteobacteria bacterium]
MPDTGGNGEYAPLYSRKERIRIALMLAVIITPIALISHFWLIPRISAYAEFANCYSYGNMDGLQLLLKVAFVYLPLSFAIFLLLLLGRRCIRIIRARQDPLPGEKVLRPTRYRYGNAALILPAVVLLIVIVITCFAIWGSFQADRLGRMAVPCTPEQRIELEQSL